MSLIQQPISFPVRVDGEPMTASVIEEIIPSYHFIFRVRFSNGFEDFFYLGAGGIYGDQENSGPYAKALSMDIDHVLGMEPEKFYHIFQDYVDGVLTNIWIIEKRTPTQHSYAVYYNRFYRFELTEENGKWIAFTTAKIYPNLNFDLAKKVGLVLDKLL
jgi:hypothetical protein